MIDLERRKLIQWSIIQHYEICDTPLLDITNSLRVACTFAVKNEIDNEWGYIYVLAMPYLTNRITINSEENLLLIRLQSITPTDAKRPYFQEGFMSGTTDITDQYRNKDELDFNCRLAGKFVFANEKKFWGSSFSRIKDEFIYPPNDKFLELAKYIKNKRLKGFYEGSIGDFLLLWNELETKLKKSIPDKKFISTTNIIENYVKYKNQNISFHEIDNIRRFRNRLVHDTKSIDTNEINKNFFELKKVLKNT